MVALNFNANSVQPSYGGDPGLPDGLYPTVIIKTEQVPVEKMGTVVGSFLAITHSVVDGPLKGQTMVDRLNLAHSNPQTVEIANKQLSAYCHVLGVFQAQDSQQLHNIPMQIEVGRQLDKNTKQPTAFGEIKRIYDRNGNAPGKAGQQGQNQGGGNNAPIPDRPAGGVTTDGNGWQGGGNGGNQGGGNNGGNAGGFGGNGGNGGFGGGDQNGGGFGGGQNQGGNGGQGGGFGGGQGDPNASGGNWGAGGQGGGQGGGFGGGGADPNQGGGGQGGNAGGGNWQPNNGGAGGPSWGAGGGGGTR